MEKWIPIQISVLISSKSDGEFHQMSSVLLNPFGPFSGSVIPRKMLLLLQLPTSTQVFLSGNPDVCVWPKGERDECGCPEGRERV